MDFDDFYHNGEPLQLPRPNAEVKYHGDDAEWTEKQVRGVICNPIYAGIGPYSTLVDDAAWVKGAKKAIETDGPEQFLVNVLYLLREAFADAEIELDE